MNSVAYDQRAVDNAGYGCPLELEKLLARLVRLTGADKEPVRMIKEREARYLEAVRRCVSAPSFDRSTENLMRVCGIVAVMIIRFKAEPRESSAAVEAIARVASEEALRGAKDGDLRRVHAYLAFVARVLGAARSKNRIELPGNLGSEIASALRDVRCCTTRDEEIRRKLAGVLRDVFLAC